MSRVKLKERLKFGAQPTPAIKPHLRAPSPTHRERLMTNIEQVLPPYICPLFKKRLQHLVKRKKVTFLDFEKTLKRLKSA